MSLYLGDQKIAGINTPVQGRVLGQIIQSTIPLTDAGLHLLDGSTIAGTGAYSAFYNHMSNGYNSNSIGMKGNVSNNNGVFSNFDSNNYLFIPNAKTVDNSEYVFKFTTGSDIVTKQTIVHCEYLFCIELSSGSFTTWGWSRDSSAHGTKIISTSVSANTTYWIKVNIDGFSKTFSYSTDGINYTQSVPATWSDDGIDTSANYQFRLGLSSYNSTNPFLGSIDIKECYIKQNNTYLWNGADYTILPNYYTDTAEYERCLENYGACGKFVLDTVNQTIRLPKITSIIEGTVNVSTLGDLIEAGLPNITGAVHNLRTSNGADSGFSGAFSYTDTTTYPNDNSSHTSRTYYNGITFDASLSSSVYGNSDTVQPQTIKAYVYIVIATLTKTDIEIDIDEVMTDLNTLQGDVNNKVSKDSLIETITIIETYSNGSSWYNLYSNGWIEQGGKHTYSGNSQQTVSLLKSIDTTRPIYFSYKLVTTRSAGAYERECNVNSYTSSSFVVYTSTSNGSQAFWEAKGYIL